jgi:hypothetical protein
MGNTVLSMLATVLIAASQALAAQSRHHIRRETAASERFRNTRNTFEQPSQPSWPCSGWSDLQAADTRARIMHWSRLCSH